MCSCDEALELISARLDGALSEAEAAELEAHLAECPACRALLDDLEGLHAALPNLWAEPPAGLKDRIMDRVRADAAPARKKQKNAWKGFLAMAAVFAVVVLGARGMDLFGRMGAGSTASGGNAAPAAGAAGDMAVSGAADTAPRSGETSETASQADMDTNNGKQADNGDGAAPEAAFGETEADWEPSESPAGGGESPDAGGGENGGASQTPAAAPVPDEPAPLPAPANGPTADGTSAASEDPLEAVCDRLGGDAVWQREAIPGGYRLLSREDPAEEAVLLWADRENGMLHLHSSGEPDIVRTVTVSEDGRVDLVSEPGENPCPLCGYGS